MFLESVERDKAQRARRLHRAIEDRYIAPLYDMAGNVAEWCQDQVPAGTSQNPFASRELRLLKGGSWCSRARELRSAARQFAPPQTADGFIGFRVVRSLSKNP